MADYFQGLTEKANQAQEPNIGFKIPVWNRRVVNPLGPGKESNVRDYIRQTGLGDLDTLSKGELSSKLQNSAPNDWDSIVKSYAGKAASEERLQNVARDRVSGDRKSEMQLQEDRQNRQNAQSLANQRMLMEEGRKSTQMQIGSNEKLAGMQNQNALDIANLQAGTGLRQTEMQGRFGLQQAKVQGDYGLQQSRIQGDYGVRQAQIGANAGIRQAEIGAQSARDVANISGNWGYRTTDLMSGRQLTDSREQRSSDERRQSQSLLAQRQEMGEQRKRAEASELLQSRLGRAESGKNFLLGAIGRRYF